MHGRLGPGTECEFAAPARPRARVDGPTKGRRRGASHSMRGMPRTCHRRQFRVDEGCRVDGTGSITARRAARTPSRHHRSSQGRSATAPPTVAPVRRYYADPPLLLAVPARAVRMASGATIGEHSRPIVRRFHGRSGTAGCSRPPAGRRNGFCVLRNQCCWGQRAAAPSARRQTRRAVLTPTAATRAKGDPPFGHDGGAQAVRRAAFCAGHVCAHRRKRSRADLLRLPRLVRLDAVWPTSAPRRRLSAPAARGTATTAVTG